MQRENLKKPFTLTHERFVLEVDPSVQFIKGIAELTIQPHNDKLNNIKINSRQCKIEQVYVNDASVDFKCVDAITDLDLGPNTNIAHHQNYKSKYLTALRDSDEGELNVTLPDNCIKKISDGSAQQVNNNNNTNSNTTSLATAAQPQDPQQPVDITNESTEPTYTTLSIRIHYTLEEPRNGVVFVQRDDEIAPYRSNHVYTVNQPLPGATRSWLPCIDIISERCTWDMEFIVPRKDEGAIIPEYDGEGAFDEKDGMIVVCSGDILEQVIHPKDNSKKIVHYRLSEPTPAPFIGFAIGPFQMIKLSPSQLQEEVMTAADLDENQQQSLMAEINMMSNIYAFALPGVEDLLSISCSFLMHAMHFYTQEYGSYPFQDYKLAFVEDAWADTASSASLTICSSRLLHTDDITDQIYSTRRELSQALARQWFGIYIVQKSWPDTWLVRGIANLMGSLFIKRHLGNNEYRLRMKKDMELCCQLDVNRPPVYNQTLPYPLDPEDLDFIDLKAPLVIYMLDKRMCKGGGTLGLSRVLPKILVSAMSGELAQNAISTHYFLRLCRKVSGFDTKLFAEQWIYKSGCPKFAFKFHFNRKKMVVEIHMTQENTNAYLNAGQEQLGACTDGSSVNYQELMNPLFTGNLTVRIHEADGTPYEHILDIQSPQHKFEVQFNTKYKRIRRNTKRFLAKQAAAAAAVAEEEQENEEGEANMVLGIIPTLGLGMPIFEDPNQKKEWRIVEWGQDEEDTSGASSSMFDWIRLDAEFEWLCVCDFQQPDYMWAAQLTKDRDVVAQHEAIEALSHMPSLATSTSFLRAVIDPKCFYKIRMEATYGLAACARESLNWVGLHQLNKMFHTRFCFSDRDSTLGEDDLPMGNSIPKPNNFANLPEYFLQKASVVAFSQIRDSQGLVPVRIRSFLLDLLKYNDNNGNEFSDCYYVATLLSALGDALIPLDENAVDSARGEEVNKAAILEIERFRTLDYVIPTYHNIVTVTCLRTMTKLMLKNLMPVNISMFLQYTRYGNYVEIRLAAFDSLFILCGLANPVVNRYLIQVIKEDLCVSVSHYVARAMLSWLGLAMKENSDVRSGGSGDRFVEEFAEEEGKVVVVDERVMKKTPQQEFQASVENLRKRFENDIELQQTIWDLLNSAENAKLDHCIRKYLLQFCEYMFKPVDSLLKISFRMSTVPTHNINGDISEPTTPTSATSVIRIPNLPNKRKDRPAADEEKPPKHHKKSNSIHIKTESLQHDIPPQLSSADTVSSPLLIDSTVTDNDMVMEEATSHQTRRKSSYQPTSVVIEEVSAAPTPLPPHVPVATPVVKVLPPKPKTKKVDRPTAEELKKCRTVLNKMTKQQCALPFSLPVDEELDMAKGYYQVITKPMDLSTIKRKVETKEYTKFRQFEDDVRLMISNCYKFNKPGQPVYNEGQALEAFFEKEVAIIHGREHEEEMQNMTIVESPATTPRATPAALPFSPSPVASTSTSAPPALTSVVINPPKPVKVKSVAGSSPAALSQPSLSTKKSASVPVATASSVSTTASQAVAPSAVMTEKRKPISQMTERERMKQVLYTIMKSSFAYEFSFPVDPIKQEIPKYLEVIKTPMDLGTIRSRLKAHQYANAQAMDADIRLVLNNCYTFNQPGSYVYDHAQSLENLYEEQWKIYFGARRESIDGTTTNEAGAIPSVESPVAPPPPPPPRGQPTLKIKTSEKAASTSSPSAVKPVKPPKVPKTAQPGPSTAISNSASHELTATASEKVKAKPAAPEMIVSMNEINKKKCDRVLKKLWGLQESVYFREPVDAVALNIPQYYEYIKRPMCLRKVQKNFDENKYATVWDMELDVRQIFWNCYSFNATDSEVYRHCQAMERFFNQIWSAEYAILDALKGEDRKIAYDTVSKLTYHAAAPLFNAPVDTEVITDYLKVIEQPMDLRTIWERLESGKYSTLKAIDSDIRLVFKNCFVYNAKNPDVYKVGEKLQTYYNQIGKKMRERMNGTTTTTASPSSTVAPTVPSTNKRRSSGSPAPKAANTVAMPTEEQRPAKAPKMSPKPRKPTVKEEPSATSGIDYMDADPVLPSLPVSPITLVPSVAKNPSAPKAPSVPKSPVAAAGPMAKSQSVSKSPAVAKSSSAAAHKPQATSKPSAGQKLDKAVKTRLEKFLNGIKSIPLASAFTVPVDWEYLGIPHYPLIIKHPMDLGTMSKKLKKNEYLTVRDFESDMRTIYNNCYTFNGLDHAFSKHAQVLESLLNREIRRINGESSGNSEMDKYVEVLDKLAYDDHYSLFASPVDPVILQIPTYLTVVKQPMDFSTIRDKIKKNVYANADQFLKDVILVFYNCYLFNQPGDPVTESGKKLEAKFNRLCSAAGLQTITVDMTKGNN